MTQTNPIMDLAQAEARLPRWMLALAGAGTLSILLSTHVRFGAGFAVGSGLGILNYLWLHHIIEALVNAGRVRPAKTVLAKVFVRYPLMFAGVYLFYKSGGCPLRNSGGIVCACGRGSGRGGRSAPRRFEGFRLGPKMGGQKVKGYRIRGKG